MDMDTKQMQPETLLPAENLPAADAPTEDAGQNRRHLARLTAQMDHLQSQIDQIQAEVTGGGDQIATLVRHLTSPQTAQPVLQQVADLAAHLTESQEQLATLAGEVKKLTRTQFKSNTLAESKDQQVENALSTLQELADHRQERTEARQTDAQRQLDRLRTEARGELAADLLPGLDGLERAMQSGRGFLARQKQVEAARLAAWQEAQLAASATPPAPSPEPGTLVRWWQRVIGDDPVPARQLPPLASPPPTSQDPALVAELSAWLQGLELVQERFLRLLADEAIRPIPALGQPFDPHLHVAIDTVAASDQPSGVVLEVLRLGYTQGRRVLRYAEVIVSRPTHSLNNPEE